MKNLELFFESFIKNDNIVSFLTTFTAVIFIILLAFGVKWIFDKIIIRYIKKYSFAWNKEILNRKVLQKISHIIPAIIIYNTAYLFDTYQVFIQKLTLLYIIVMMTIFVNAILNTLHDVYQKLEISKTRPIKIFVQVAQFVVWIIGGIIIVSSILEQNPLILFGGLGAMTAVLMLIFQNSILGFVAGIQISANDMVRIGDWIEMPSTGADGYVQEISLVTVKVQNFDKTIVSVPTHSLITNSFTNWRGMFDSGGRRIKRSIYIDMNSIKVCDQEMLENLKKVHYLTDYINQRSKEIAEYNKENKIDKSVPVNGRAMTNIGTFRHYIENYLANHPKIKGDFTKMVRQLSPDERGLPIEIYAFTTTTAWVEYEDIQADIFDHIIAIAPHFGLRVFQSPSGSDLKNIQM